MAQVLRNFCLLISNNAVNQAIFSMALNDVSPDSVCIIAEDESEAINFLSIGNVKPDLILADRHFPGFDAIQFIDKIKVLEVHCKSPIILHCSEGEVTERERTCGADALYCKEYSLEGIRNILYVYLSVNPAPIILN